MHAAAEQSLRSKVEGVPNSADLLKASSDSKVRPLFLSPLGSAGEAGV